MQENYTDDAVVETGNGEHVNPDGETDAQKGMRAGGIGGAVTGAVAGSMMGPAGALLGAAVGGLVGAVASGAAVSVADRMDDDSATDHNPEPEMTAHDLPGVQTGGYANDGTPDTRGMMEKTADAITGDNIDDKTGKVVDDRTNLPLRGENWDSDRRYDETYDERLGNGLPGIQTGGYANDGSPDTRGMTEKAADAITGDYIDDKTGKVVSDGPPPLIDNGIPGVQTGGHTRDGSPDTRGISEKVADAVTGDNTDDKTGKRVS
ncbi:MAG: hypothetical protein QM758_04385 [Armatimonas sp.]